MVSLCVEEDNSLALEHWAGQAQMTSAGQRRGITFLPQLSSLNLTASNLQGNQPHYVELRLGLSTPTAGENQC